MFTQPGFVPPRPRVVDEDGVVDTVLRVVDVGPILLVDHADDIAVDDHALVVLVDPDRAVERAMHGISSQQRRSLLEVVGAPGTQHDRTQDQLVATAGLLDQQACKQPADSAESEEHDVLRLGKGFDVATDDVATGFTDILQRRNRLAPLLSVHQTDRQLADIDVRRSQVKLRQRLHDGVAFELGEFVFRHLPDEPVRFHDVGDASVVQRAPVAVDDHVLAVQLADDGNHRLRQRLAFLPIREVVLKVGQCHGGSLAW